MIYSDVIDNNLHLIVKKKNKYTMHDVNKVYENLFLEGKNYSVKQCKFIIVCTAIFHDATYSKSFWN